MSFNGQHVSPKANDPQEMRFLSENKKSKIALVAGISAKAVGKKPKKSK